jgi:hypothetical protein
LARIAQARDAILDLLAGDDDVVALRDTLSMVTDLPELADALLAELSETEALAAGLAERQAKTKRRLTRLNERADAFRDGLRSLLIAAGLRTLERPEATLSLAKGQEVVRYAKDFECPTQLLKKPPPPERDGQAIKASLKAGEAISGAWLERTSDSIRIRDL